MRKIIFLLMLSACLFSCGSLLPKYSQHYYIGDFRPYTKDGFVLAPTTDGYKYQSIGIISIDFHPGVRDGEMKVEKKILEPSDVVKGADPMYGPSDTGLKTTVFYPSYDYCLAELIAYAKSLGATGILDLKIVTHYEFNSQGYKSIDYYEASGFAVVIEK